MTRPCLLAAIVATMLGAAAARAETNFALRDVGRGVTLPTPHGVAGDFDVTTSRSNPAGLATLAGFSLGLGATRLAEDRTVMGGGGWGAFLALPLTLRLKEGEPFRLSYGFAWEQVQSPSTWRATPGDPRTGHYDASLFVNSVGVGTRLASFGWSIVQINWADSPQSQGTTTHNIGANLRPGRFLALGAAWRDVFEPTGRDASERLERSFDVEAAVRPLGDWRLEVAAGAVFGEDGFIDLRGRAIVRPLDGVSLFAHVESVERPFGGPGAPPSSRDLQVLVGLGFDLRFGRRQETAGASYGTLTSHKGAGSPYAGSSVFAHMTDEAFPSLVEPARFERIEIAGERDEREHVRTIVRLGELERTNEVRGVVLELSENDLGWGRTEELREQVAALRRKGKLVFTFLKHAGMRQIYLASAGDRILMHPAATIELRGIAALQFFARFLIDKIGIEAQVSQIAEYKSAGEILTRTGPSDAAREQTRAYIGDIHNRFLQAVSRERGVTTDRLTEVLARPALTPPEILAEKLIDEIAHDDVVEERVGKVLGRKVRFSKERPAPPRPSQWGAPEIAVVHVTGEIVDGPEGDGLFSQNQTPRQVAEAIRDAREKSDVRAIVLRVNSPGGMVQPSELIAREVELTRGKKPILVSMGDVAASGGYWVAAPADAIFASPSTLTGSIGIVSVRVSVGNLARQIGITSSVEKTAPHADAYDPFRPFSPEELKAHEGEMRYIYDRFLDRVAAGRHKPRDAVDPIARGRIWSGERALGNGLVDKLQGLGAVIQEAKRRAGLSDRTRVNVVSLPPEAGSILERLVKPPGADALPLPAAVRKMTAAVPRLYLYPSSRPLARAPWVEAAMGVGPSP
jgi:protease IV